MKLGIQDRTTTLTKKQAFITLKDLKENFMNPPKCRPINPAKSTLGRVSKQIVERMNSRTREKTKVHQWKNTKSVIEWFNQLESKESCSFIQFEIADFYPSITEKLLKKAIDYVQDFVPITDGKVELIMHARKLPLFNKGVDWMKICQLGSTGMTV